MKKPDNIVYDVKNDVYDAFKKPYATSFTSKSFNKQKIKIFKSEAQNYFTTKFLEIKESYENLLEEIEWSTLIENAKYNFNPDIGKTYYLYKGEENNFLSIIHPKEWDTEHLGSYKLTSKNTWNKVE